MLHVIISRESIYSAVSNIHGFFSNNLTFTYFVSTFTLNLNIDPPHIIIMIAYQQKITLCACLSQRGCPNSSVFKPKLTPFLEAQAQLNLKKYC